MKKRIIVPSLALLLASNLFANELYTNETTSLKDAISRISKIANIPYVVDTRIFEGKKAKKIKNIQGLENALREVLKGTNLEAIIENDMIMIRKKSIVKSNSSDLGKVEVIENLNNITEGTGSYTIASMNTATRMNLSIKETPQSVSVLTNEQMKDLNISSIKDAIDNSTGLSSIARDERIYFRSRAFPIDNFQIDGLSSNIESRNNNTVHELDIYDRIEIVRGSTGLLSGAGEPSATINFIRKKANSKDFQGNLNVELGSWDKKKVRLDLNSPLNEAKSIRGRVIISKKKSESFRDFYKNDTDLFYATVEGDTSDNSLLSLGLSYQKVDSKGTNFRGLPGFYSDGSKTNFDVSKTTASPWTFRDVTQKKYFVNYSHYFMNDIKLNMAYSHNRTNESAKVSDVYDYENNFDKTSGLGLISDAIAYPSSFIKQDVFDIHTSVPFFFNKLEHEFVAGLSYVKTRKASEFIWGGPTNNGSFYSWKGAEEPNWGVVEPFGDTTIKQKAFYTATRLSLLKDLKVIFGARITNYENKGMSKDYIPQVINREHNNVITPYFGVVYNLNENYSIYGSYTDIFKAQEQRNEDGKLLDPKTGKTYEAGLKASFFEDKLNAYFSVYNIQQDDLALADGTKKVLGTMEQAYYSAKGVEVKGFEAEISGEVNSDLNLSLGLSSYSARDGSSEKILPYVPTKTVKLNASYKIDKFTLGAGINWQNKIYQGKGNNKLEQKPFFLVNAMARYDLFKDMSLQLNVHNIFNKKYYGGLFDERTYIYGEPRKITASLNWKF